MAFRKHAYSGCSYRVPLTPVNKQGIKKIPWKSPPFKVSCSFHMICFQLCRFCAEYKDVIIPVSVSVSLQRDRQTVARTGWSPHPCSVWLDGNRRYIKGRGVSRETPTVSPAREDGTPAVPEWSSSPVRITLILTHIHICSLNTELRRTILFLIQTESSIPNQHSILLGLEVLKETEYIQWQTFRHWERLRVEAFAMEFISEPERRWREGWRDLSVCLRVCQPACLCVCKLAHWNVYWSVSLSFQSVFCLLVRLSVCWIQTLPGVCLRECVLVCASVPQQSPAHLSLCPSPGLCSSLAQLWSCPVPQTQ